MKIQADNIMASFSNIASSEYEKSKIKSFQDSLESVTNNRDNEELKKVAQEFEAFFIKTIFKSMRQTSKLSESFIEKSFDREMYEQMMDEKMAEKISTGRGIGLADKLYQQMVKQYGYSDEKNDENTETFDVLK